jgi:hypothetical protein
MSYNIYDEISELINAEGEVSLESAKKLADELKDFIDRCLKELEIGND